jgi:hypothetical protein
MGFYVIGPNILHLLKDHPSEYYFDQIEINFEIFILKKKNYNWKKSFKF